MEQKELIEASIEVIVGHQAPGGAYPASPDYPTYRYCWFRDGSFTARAMDTWGRFDSSARFHEWAAQAVLARKTTVVAAISDPGSPPTAILHTRYRLDGTPGDEEWPNFQLDGFGTWLWSLERHVSESGADLPDRWREAADLAAGYLAAHWDRPCYDLWEEHPDRVHPYTLGAIHAGLAAHHELTGTDQDGILAAIEQTIRDRGIVDGRLVKSLDGEDIDASLVALGAPYGVFDPHDPVMAATVAAIEDKLNDGGVHRYRTDTFYGGGGWVLLAAWLAWHHRQVGNEARAADLLAWVEAQADADLNLPEQVSTSVNDPAWVQPWIEKWGPVAKPLLWSHAMYLLALSP